MNNGDKQPQNKTTGAAGNDISRILRQFINQPSFGNESFKRSKEEDPLLHQTVCWLLLEPNFLYYQPSEALTQINALKNATTDLLSQLENLHPTLTYALSVGMEDLWPRKTPLLGQNRAKGTNSLFEIENPLKKLRLILLMDSIVYENASYPTIRRGPGRPKNQSVHDTAEKIAIYFRHHKRRLPGTGTGIQPSPFQRCVKEILIKTNIKADSRRACESALSKLRKKSNYAIYTGLEFYATCFLMN